MEIRGERLMQGPREVVWDTLLDPAVLASVLPGCEKLERVGEDEYEGRLEIRMGPVQGVFMGKVKLEDMRPPEAYTMRVDGRGAPGFVKATGHLTLEAVEEGTRVAYEGDARVGGRLAAVGQRLVESSAKSIIRQSLDGLDRAVQERAAAAAASPAHSEATSPPSATPADPPAESPTGEARRTPATRPSPSPRPPSQAEFAANVARDVARDLIPAPVRWAAVIVLAVLALWILYMLVT